MTLIFLFLSIFLSFPLFHVNIKNCVGFFSGTIKSRMLKLGIHMDNELLYYGIENRTPCPILPFICPYLYPVLFDFVFRQ